MERLRISKRVVDATEPAEKPFVLWDSDVPGFGLKVHPSGRKTYIFKYRVGGGRSGRRREPVLGVHGSLTPDQARRRAQEMSSDVLSGGDPAATREKERAAPRMQDLLERYLREHAQLHKKAASIRNDQRIIAKTVLPKLGSTKVADVSREDILSLHQSKKATPYEANRTLALLSKIFNLAELWGLRDDGTNPCRHVKRFKEERRERLLSEQEIARLGQILTQADTGSVNDGSGTPRLLYRPAIDALRLLLLTGARSGEVLSLQWGWINWRQSRAELPDSKTGRKFVYLPPPALKVLDDIKDRDPDKTFVIKGRRPGTHLVNLKDTWAIVRSAAELSDVRVHDLRHCFASIGAMDGMSLPMIGALLGHRSVSTTQRYAHLSDNPVRAASEQIGSRLDALLQSSDNQTVEQG